MRAHFVGFFVFAVVVVAAAIALVNRHRTAPFGAIASAAAHKAPDMAEDGTLMFAAGQDFRFRD